MLRRLVAAVVLCARATRLAAATDDATALRFVREGRPPRVVDGADRALQDRDRKPRRPVLRHPQALSRLFACRGAGLRVRGTGRCARWADGGVPRPRRLRQTGGRRAPQRARKSTLPIAFRAAPVAALRCPNLPLSGLRCKRHTAIIDRPGRDPIHGAVALTDRMIGWSFPQSARRQIRRFDVSAAPETGTWIAGCDR